MRQSRTPLYRYLQAGLVALFVIVSCGPPVTVSALGANAPRLLASVSSSEACSSLSNLNSSQGCGNGQSVVNKLLNRTVALISFVGGAIAVVMIIVAGLRFITANGDSNNITRARQALIYATIGLLIMAVAQLLVHTVLAVSSR